MSVLAPRLVILSSTASHKFTKRSAGSLSSAFIDGGTNIIRSYWKPTNATLAPFSTSSSNTKEFAKLTRLEDANPERINGIQVNPDSLGYNVLPGNLTYKTYKWSGNTRKIPLELAHGYFWMVSDLKKTNQKPTLSNETLIPEGEAQLFPTLEGLTTLDDLDTVVDLPLFFL
eukprot:jgi/Psemu1/301652/fgenesh1_kg.41_\